jgi:CheY-like chemotaxis protein
MPPAAAPPLVLIAEDNADTREMYAEYLGAVGYRVETARDGQEAVLKTHRLRPDAVVMDLVMPRLDGLAAVSALQNDARTAAIPVIILTGHDLKQHLKRAAISAGAVSYLMKPCLPEVLEREVASRISARLDAASRASRRASSE